MRSAYIHFPFCESKCHYCDFFSFAESKIEAPLRDSSYDAIASETKLALSAQSHPLSTIFFGGGTPSLVPLDRFATTLSLLPKDERTEVTMEANPSSITLERAESWRRAGVNRFSMGTQALDDERLKWLGRVHSVDSIYRALDALFSAGITNVSVDYIVGVPAQTEALIADELSEILRRFPLIKHVSAYLLTLKDQNPKSKELPPEDVQLSHLMTTASVLADLGFEQYEISNFARPGFKAQHNENYWLGGSYQGIGPSAHSFFPDKKMRTKNWSNLHKYISSLQNQQQPWEWTETLDSEQERIEYLMLRLRRAEGVLLTDYNERFGRRLETERESQIQQAVNQGFAQIDGTRLRLTPRGLFLSDQIINNLM